MARILVIDDEPTVRGVLRCLLEASGHTVDEASGGDEGLSQFTACPADLVMIDMLMPKKGGLTTIRELREQFPQLKIIAISGGGSNGKLNFLSTAKTFPGVRTLPKPFRYAELIRTVNEVLAGSSDRRKLAEGTLSTGEADTRDAMPERRSALAPESSYGCKPSYERGVE